MTTVNERSAVELAAASESGALSAEAIVAGHIERIAERDGTVRAWTHLAAEQALAQARLLDRGPRRGLLHGIPIAVKDIIDTVDMPTGYGSPIYAGFRPAWDASCVALVRAAGAIVLGKTVTTEFAYFRPGPTANPYDPAHTPGGSSSGSAAAVADFMAPLGFGSQTAGSLIRPASYCGVVGYKPSYGHFSLAGVKGLAHSLDTLGWMARSVDDIALLRAVLSGARFAPPDGAAVTAPRLGLCRTHEWAEAEPATIEALSDTARRLEAAGATISEVSLPPDFVPLCEMQKSVMAFEAARALAFEKANHADRLSPALNALLEQGAAIDLSDHLATLAEVRARQRQLAEIFARYDALLTPSAPGEAPAGLAATGDPVFSRVWTLLHLPSISLPGHVGPGGLPVGIQLVGPLDGDESLLRLAAWAAPRIRS